MIINNVIIISKALDLFSIVEADTRSTALYYTFEKIYNQVVPIHSLPNM